MASVAREGSLLPQVSVPCLEDVSKDYILRETQIRCWIEQALDVKFECLDLSEVLHSGVYLCRLMLAIEKGSVPRIHEQAADYLYRENIDFFIQAMEEYAVPVRFAAPDLLNKRNMKLVLESLLKLSELATERRFRVQLPPISSLSLPSLDSLTPSHKRMVQNIVRFSKSRFTPIVPPRSKHQSNFWLF